MRYILLKDLLWYLIIIGITFFNQENTIPMNLWKTLTMIFMYNLSQWAHLIWLTENCIRTFAILPLNKAQLVSQSCYLRYEPMDEPHYII